MSIKDRFKMIMEREKLTAGAFAESIGVAQATISHILGPRNKYPSTEVILRLHQRYSDISLEWLLTGQGSMSNDAEASVSTPENIGADYPLFAENAENPAKGTDEPENRKEMALAKPSNTPKEIVKQEIIYKERPPRKITEIRIFFDDNTYETFKPA
ncbi:helix-turn-helix domain-containing protein [uncultured Mediterranea sp.]|uniref:helix-turn-helix domain-containing protein n=1 Tax=uncultured Mediterranea sp. TaxID=1926662 RepID=UPI0027D9767B|nr:helix-turn-helix domain-containing protein [uncultured Mediterranea sp.]